MIRTVLSMATVVAFFAPAGLMADDYFLAAGESDTLSGAATYGTMTVNGDLTVTGGKTVTVKTLVMTNGSITVTGTDTMLGSGNSGEAYNPTAWSMYPDEEGNYGTISIENVKAADKGAGAATFYLRAENDAVHSETGYIDFLELNNGSMNLRSAYNETSLTGRVSVVGSSSSTIYRRGQRQPQPIFCSGAWAIRMEDGANVTINLSQQGGYLNEVDTTVDFSGNANVTISGGYNTSYPVSLNRGAHLSNNGTLAFTRSGTYTCLFQINDSDVIGPGVTTVSHTSNASAGNESRIQIASGVVATMRNVAITGNYAYLMGPGTARIDASASVCSFKSNIKAGNSLVVEKVGANEMVVSATTNIPNLVVSEGVVRFTGDCTVSGLNVASGAAVIADGCSVTLEGEIVGASLGTENGGVFLKSAESRVVMYDPCAVTGALHVANGELAFSKYGYANQFWRFTFTGVKSGVSPLYIRGLYLFAGDGTWQNSGLGYVAPANEMTTSVLAAGKTRWYCSSATNVASKAGEYSYYDFKNLFKIFRYSDNDNHYPRLTSPRIDPENPDSYLAVEMRLSNSAKPVTGYNLRAAGKSRYANAWKIEVSDDGLDWTQIEERKDQTFSISGDYNTYDNVAYVKNSSNAKEFFHFTGYRHGGLAAMDPLSVQVDDGATLDLLAFDDGQPVDAITIDLSSGGGTVKGGRIVANGVLTIENATGGALSEALPLVLEDTQDTANFASWSVMVNGRRRRAAVICEGNRIRVQLAGLAVFLQ